MSTEHQAWKNDPDYDRTHARRFQQSLAWLEPHLQRHAKILELGGRGSFTALLEETIRRAFGTAGIVPVHFCEEDLRYRSTQLLGAGGCYDIVLCMEVFEHLHDQETARPTEWRATGTECMLHGAWHVLKPGGLLFLTTPNACSLNVLFKVLTMQAPMVYRPHVREYSPEEIAGMVKAAGFVIERFETLDVWGGGCTGTTRSIVENLLERFGHHSPHRGEDIFVLARKPAR